MFLMAVEFKVSTECADSCCQLQYCFHVTDMYSFSHIRLSRVISRENVKYVAVRPYDTLISLSENGFKKKVSLLNMLHLVNIGLCRLLFCRCRNYCFIWTCYCYFRKFFARYNSSNELIKSCLVLITFSHCFTSCIWLFRLQMINETMDDYYCIVIIIRLCRWHGRSA